MASTYLDIKSVNLLINAIGPDSDGGSIQSAWMNILGKRVFSDGIYAVETNRRRSTRDLNVIVIEVKEPWGGTAVDVLIVECQKPQANRTECHFDELANVRLDRQLTETTNSSNFIFGAAAIGREVRFYKKLTGQNPQPLHSGIYDISTDPGSRNVTYWLQYIKDNAPPR
ncbi:MAG: hypothetical protein M1813_005212 [Trichoglossum hirsutum]|nr:MAG: hypothetical protein M1813_005212 [Trichoglossum hirsutum]